MQINYRRKLKLKSEKGFTLLEVVVSVVLLSIVAVAFTAVFSNGNRFIFISGDRMKYTQSAASVMERFYSESIAEMDDTAFSTYVSNSLGTTAQVSSYESVNIFTPGKSIKIARQMAVPAAGADGCWITVTVFYRDGSQHSSLTSFFRKGG